MLQVEYVTDPACPWSWGAEPVRWRVEREFAAEVAITCVMGGVAREFGPPDRLVAQWLDVADRTRMPLAPRLWWEGPPRSAELWGLALAWRARPEPRLTGELWSTV